MLILAVPQANLSAGARGKGHRSRNYGPENLPAAGGAVPVFATSLPACGSRVGLIDDEAQIHTGRGTCRAAFHHQRIGAGRRA